MRISDWSSDVCSSDLGGMMYAFKTGLSVATTLAAAALSPAVAAGESIGRPWTLEDILLVPEVNEIALSRDGRLAIYAAEIADEKIGRASCRERVCQYV